ncbi:MAG: diphthine--ammonia ligase [Thermoplasmata archaeon]|nr:diphthine--ammonia ligase [Thermoplasmata archaeon]
MSEPDTGVTALVSGGKDSLYSAYLFDAQGGSVDELLTLKPSDPSSWMFHTPNLAMVELQARAWGKRYREVSVEGTGEDAELAALRTALAGSRGWVTAGAIASSYQWARLSRICFELSRPLFAPLWGKEAGRVVREEVGAGLDIRLVHLAAEGLGPDLIGRRLDLAMLSRLERRSTDGRGLHVAGEGGEYETLVVDAPFWSSRIGLDETQITREASVTSLTVRRATLVPHDARQP